MRKLIMLLLVSFFMGIAPAKAQLEVATTSAAGGVASCAGDALFSTLISQVDWSNNFTISIFGVSLGTWPNPPLMYQPPICVCPSWLWGTPMPGMGMSFWEPSWLVESERVPGCLRSLGGVSVLGSAYAALAANAHTGAEGQQASNRTQVHWFRSPVMALMDMFTTNGCTMLPEFDLVYLTELDPFHQSDVMALWRSPETALFANVPSQVLTMVDVIPATLGFPIDVLFWVAGAWGDIALSSGNTSSSNSDFTSNLQTVAKHMQFAHRVGLLRGTIGPAAYCTAYYSPVIIKSQYRFNQVAPVPRLGVNATGSAGLYLFPPVHNFPTKESSTFMIWQGKQCCYGPWLIH